MGAKNRVFVAHLLRGLLCLPVSRRTDQINGEKSTLTHRLAEVYTTRQGSSSPEADITMHVLEIAIYKNPENQLSTVPSHSPLVINVLFVRARSTCACCITCKINLWVRCISSRITLKRCDKMNRLPVLKAERASPGWKPTGGLQYCTPSGRNSRVRSGK